MCGIAGVLGGDGAAVGPMIEALAHRGPDGVRVEQVAGGTVGRWFTDRDGGSVVAGLTGIGAGGLLGLVSGLLVFVAGGSLGDGALAEVGAPPVTTGIAVALQSGIAAAVAATATRWRRL